MPQGEQNCTFLDAGHRQAAKISQLLLLFSYQAVASASASAAFQWTILPTDLARSAQTAQGTRVRLGRGDVVGADNLHHSRRRIRSAAHKHGNLALPELEGIVESLRRLFVLLDGPPLSLWCSP